MQRVRADPSLSRVPAEVDRQLADLARSAQRGDRDARNAIYLTLAPRFAPIFMRIRTTPLWSDRAGRAWTFEDLEQEAFLIVCDLIDRWRGDRDGIAGYLFGQLPWRLRDTLRSWSISSRHETPYLPVGLPADGITDLTEVQVMVESLLAKLPAESAEVLRWRLLDGLRDREIAERLGIHERTLRRRRMVAYQQARELLLSGCVVHRA